MSGSSSSSGGSGRRGGRISLLRAPTELRSAQRNHVPRMALEGFDEGDPLYLRLDNARNVFVLEGVVAIPVLPPRPATGGKSSWDRLNFVWLGLQDGVVSPGWGVILCFDEMADFAYRTLRYGDRILVKGKLRLPGAFASGGRRISAIAKHISVLDRLLDRSPQPDPVSEEILRKLLEAPP